MAASSRDSASSRSCTVVPGAGICTFRMCHQTACFRLTEATEYTVSVQHLAHCVTGLFFVIASITRILSAACSLASRVDIECEISMSGWNLMSGRRGCSEFGASGKAFDSISILLSDISSKLPSQELLNLHRWPPRNYTPLAGLPVARTIHL